MKHTKSLVIGLMLAATCGWSTSGFTQEMDQVLKALDDALPGELIHNPLVLDWEFKGNDLRSKIVDASELPSGKAISAKLKKKQQRPWDSVLFVDIEGEIKSGDTVQVHYWARTKKPATGKETGDMILFVGRKEEPYDSVIIDDVLPGREWKLMMSSGVAESDFKANTLKAEYQMGRASQTIEFGPIYVSNLGPQKP